jgi:biotin operon repressor
MQQSSEEQPEKKEVKYISLAKVGEELGVDRTTVYYYVKRLKLEMYKFPLDRKAYLSIEDVERVKAAKQAASQDER